MTVGAAVRRLQRLKCADPISLVLIAACTIAGCGGGGPKPRPPPPVTPQLETVPYGALGAGGIVFLRADFSTAGGRDGIYLIDAARAISTFEFLGGATWYANSPAASPDGQSIAYTRYTDNSSLFDVYTAHVDGSGERQVSAFPGQDGPVTWTPDGSALVYDAAAADYSFNLYRQAATSVGTSGGEQITHFPYLCGSPCPLTYGDADRAAVSPSGQIAWANHSTIELTSPDGSAISTLYTLPPAAPGEWAAVHGTAWSPDGTRLAFVTLAGTTANGMAGERHKLSVTVIDKDGANESVVTTVPASGSVEIGGFSDIYSICWSADGSHFVFNVPDGDPQSHLWVVNVDGSGLTQVTTASGVWDMSVSCTH
jgi:Tol biopolymer transport system component